MVAQKTSADIEIAVRGINELKKATDATTKLSKEVDKLRRDAAKEVFKKLPRDSQKLISSTNNLNKAFAKSKTNLNKVALGTEKYFEVISDVVDNELRLNSALKRQARDRKIVERLKSKNLTISKQNIQIVRDELAKELKLARAKERTAKAEQARSKALRLGSRVQGALSSGLIGGGFPLLFGQGPTAALGGALGGVAGGALGGQFGFALSIAGTTIGSALDDLANALSKPTQNIQSLVDKLGLANTPTGDLALRLEKVGLSASAADLLLDQFNIKFGKTPEDIKKNTQQMNKFKNQINELGTAITLLLSKVLSPAIQTILNFIDRQVIANKIGRPKLASLELKAAGLATKETKEKFNFNIGAVEGPFANKEVEKFFKDREKVILKDLINQEINKKRVEEGLQPIDFKNQGLNFGDKFEGLQEKAAEAEFNKNIRSLEQSLKLEKDRLNISSEQFTLKQEQFKLDNLNADLELLRGELGKDNNLEIQRQVDGLQAQVDLQEQIVNNAKALTDPFRKISNIISQDIGDGIKGLIKGTETLNNVLNNVINKIADAALNMAIFGNTAGKFQKGGGILGLLPFADGGSPPVGRPSIVGEKGPELFVPRSSGNIIPNNKLGGGSTNNVVVNVDASGSDVQGDEAEAKELGTLISVAVQGELLKQQRPGGLLSR